MCGIVGIFDTRARRDVPRALVERMNETLHHRGPDAGGLHLEPGIGLGHRRLSIIDLATGQQPLYNEDGTVCVIFNGEIYNFQSLIPELTRLGHTFRTKSDTEVIVHAWEAWGEACVERFRGMFAFALWDRTRETLFLARDRLGVKPLYYALLPDGMLIFGSELKALLAHGGLARDIDPCAVEEYFALGYVPEPRTIFAGAVKLPPAHTLTLRRGDRAPAVKQYWDVRFTLDNRLTEPDACAELDRPARGIGPPQDDRRRAARGVPVGRGRLERSGRDHGGGERRARSTPARSRSRIRRSTNPRMRSRSPTATARGTPSTGSRPTTSIWWTGSRGSTTSRTRTARRFRPTASARSRGGTSRSRSPATAATRASAATAGIACT